MKYIKVLGCGDAFGNRGMLNTSLLLETKDHKYAVDFGATSMPALRRLQMDSDSLDGIFLTHFHGDHYGGIANLLMEASLLKKRKRELVIISPPNGEKMIRNLTEALYPNIYKFMDHDFVKFIYYQTGEKVIVNNITMQSISMIHSEGSFAHGLKFTGGGKVFAFSGDTEWTDDIFELSNNADVFICESNHYERSGPGHLSYRQIIDNKDKFKCSRIYLSHLGDDWTEENIRNSELPILSDGDIIEL